MRFEIESRHDLTPEEIDAIEDRLNDHNSQATGRHDAQGLGFVIRNEAGQLIGVAAGYSWADTSELKQLWIDKAYRGYGYARALLDAFVAEAWNRGVCRIWVASYDFQAPGFYEKAGFSRIAELSGWPRGHSNVVLCKARMPGKLKRARAMVGIPRRYSHFVFGVIQAGLTSLIAAGIASFPSATTMAFLNHWFWSWLVAWMAMLPVVVLAAPAIRAISVALTRDD
jgi:N-acetylglutamate synthase-like GNAT family acetyltransferase